MVRTWTVIEILKWTTEYFEKHDVDSPRLSAELLLCSVLGIERIRLYLDFERLLAPSELAAYRAMIERRVKKREPLQYILGHTEFYNCNLLVDPRVLIPRPETEELVDLVVEQIQLSNATSVVDVGTGSGCIAIAIAKKYPHIQVYAVDVSSEALDLAKLNAERNQVANVEFRQMNVLESEWQVPKADIFVSNPPYITLAEYAELDREVKLHEPRKALTDEQDGLCFYRRFAEILPQVLSSKGQFFCEFGYGASAGIAEVFGDYEVRILNDFSGIPRFVCGHVTHS